MQEGPSTRLARLTATLNRLQSKTLTTATELAEKFGISIRTVYRDIRALEEAGVPVVTVEGKGYSLMEGYRLPPVMFSESEANALITAEKIIMAAKDESLIREFSSAIQKIKAVLSFSSKRDLDFLEKRVVIGKTFEVKPTSKFLSLIQRALTQHRLLRIEYHSLQEQNTTRTIEPFAIYNNLQEDWILVAFCRLRQDFRSFRMDRILQLGMLDDQFEPHKITLEQYLKRYVTRNDEGAGKENL